MSTAYDILTTDQISAIRQAFTGIDRVELAAKLGSSRNTIDQIAAGWGLASPKRAREIEDATKGKIKAAILRPDIFGKRTKHTEAA